MPPKQKAVAEVRTLRSLKPHPLQAQYFKDLTPGEFSGLADDIKLNGLKQLVEILPDGTIIRGHQRTRALKHLGHKEHEVLVRHDLVDAEPEFVEREFLADNLNRRQLGPLARARVATRLFEIKQNEKHAKSTGDAAEGQLRDRIGETLGMSGRNLSRYLRLLKTPLVVQNAVDDGELAMGLAIKVADLDDRKQSALVAAIAGGVAVEEAVSKVFRPVRRPVVKCHSSVPSAVQAVLKVCRRYETELRGASTADVAPCVTELEEIGEIFRSVWKKQPKRQGGENR